ncbi:conserved hypothetical protein [Ricinus communis]|uniref:Prepilin-type N-terminal cleavage/methylation domain-containing protein n=1 Tax=Ricinus communis TaxID=3988 RepID=B9TNF7_RICCO|nr:conserved hypothetical protein [Ricinus communis]
MIYRRAQGFTLVEAIVVLVLTAILAGVAVLFIRRPVQAYVDSAARAEMADVADIALRRMAREIHSALPNSVRFSVINGVSYLEFIPTKAGGTYLAVDDGAPGGQPLDFTSTTATRFDIVGPVPSGAYAIGSGDSIVVYNLGTGFVNADAYEANPGNRATVGSLTVNGNNVTTVNFVETSNPFAKGGSANDSPRHRFSVTTQPVTFACSGNSATGQGTLTRFWNYGFPPVQVDPMTRDGTNGIVVQHSLMATNVYGCQFSVTTAQNQQAGLVGLSIALARPSPGAAGNTLETATLVQQVHLDNTP